MSIYIAVPHQTCLDVIMYQSSPENRIVNYSEVNRQQSDYPTVKPESHPTEKHLWYNCRALAVTAIAVHRTIATAIDRRLDYG